MKTTTLAHNGVSTEMVALISRLVELIPWPARRCAMGDVTVLLLDGKPRVAENVFGWNRRTVEVGLHQRLRAWPVALWRGTPSQARPVQLLAFAHTRA